MNSIDAHCDAIWKLWNHPEQTFGEQDNKLDSSLFQLRQGKIKIQFFAIYIPPSLNPLDYTMILQMIRIFERNILANNSIKQITNKQEFQEVMTTSDIGAILTLEGVDALQGNIEQLVDLYNLGLRMIGFTWNHSNWAADGHLQHKWGKFTPKGRQLIKEMDKLHMIPDVSHLSEPCFWDLLGHTHQPIVASHSNSSFVCPHSRNLSDEQIQTIIKSGGMIGLNFVPEFLSDQRIVRMHHIFRHIEHICSLGGENNIGFGSDFDGMSTKTIGLENAGRFHHLREDLYRHFNNSSVDKFLFDNWSNFLRKHLP